MTSGKASFSSGGRSIRGRRRLTVTSANITTNCPMDQAVFGFLGIDHEQLLDSIRNAKSDAEIEAFTQPFVGAKSREEIERWNRDWLSHEPQGESAKAFQGLRAQIAPERADVRTWPDLLDIDEKRRVPHRSASVS